MEEGREPEIPPGMTSSSSGYGFLMDNVECNGNEIHIKHCRWSERHDCNSNELAGVQCSHREYSQHIMQDYT